MTKEALEQLGISREDVLDRLVNKLADGLLYNEEEYSNEFQQHVEKAIRNRMDESIESALQTYIAPKVGEMIDNVCLQATNSWGEKKGKPLSFVEYLTQRVDAYVREPVNYNGKTQEEERGYSWSSSTTRIGHMIHEHLKYNIQRAMEEALGKVNSSVRKGLEEACQIALQKIEVRVNTEVKTN